MSLPPRRLPQKYNRPTSKHTRNIVKRQRNKKKNVRKERMRRNIRKVQRNYTIIQKFVLRWFLVATLGVCITVFCVLLFSSIIQVREIRVVHNSPRLDRQNVQEVLAPLFGKHLFFLSEFEVTSLLTEKFPDLADVKIQKVYPSQLVVDVTLDPLLARLDIVSPDVVDQELETGAVLTGGDFMTVEGLYVHVDFPEQYSNLRTFRLVDWGARPQYGDFLLPPDFIDTIAQAEDILTRQFGQDIRERTIFLRGQEFHLRVKDFELWFDVKSTIDQQFSRYRMFLETIGADAVTQYIDLRLTDRVVWK